MIILKWKKIAYSMENIIEKKNLFFCIKIILLRRYRWKQDIKKNKIKNMQYTQDLKFKTKGK